MLSRLIAKVLVMDQKEARNRKTAPYLSYLLRLWPVQVEEKEYSWRGSLEDPKTGKRTGFANLEELFAFLQTQTIAAAKEARMNQ